MGLKLKNTLEIRLYRITIILNNAGCKKIPGQTGDHITDA